MIILATLCAGKYNTRVLNLRELEEGRNVVSVCPGSGGRVKAWAALESAVEFCQGAVREASRDERAQWRMESMLSSGWPCLLPAPPCRCFS